MEASELKIGNWFIDRDGNQIQFDFTLHHWFDFERCEPIQLTKEWFEKFKLPKYFEFGFDTTGPVIELILMDCGGFYKTVNLPYVHTFQNIVFALTGQELELKDA